jgi:hypothetical protein
MKKTLCNLLQMVFINVHLFKTRFVAKIVFAREGGYEMLVAQ